MRKPQFGDDRPDKDTRAVKIRALFVAGRTVAAHSEYCIDNGLWTDVEIRGKAMKAIRDEVREALGALDDDGMPFAGPTPERADGAPVWRQREFWTFDDYVYNYSEYRNRAGANIEVANRIATECRERNGKGPRNLRLIEEDEPEL